MQETVTRGIRFPKDVWERVIGQAGERHASEWVRQAVEERLERQGARRVEALEAEVQALRAEVDRLNTRTLPMQKYGGVTND